MYEHGDVLLHVSIFFGHLREGIQQQQKFKCLIISNICNNSIKIQTLKWLYIFLKRSEKNCNHVTFIF